MNELPSNPILEFNPNQMVQVRKLFNYDDINRLHQDLNIFEDWIKMQQHFLVKEYDKGYLERYLINSKGSVERAKKLLDKICTVRGLMPEYLQGFDIKNEFKNYLQVFDSCILPKPTPENNRLMYYTIRNPDSTLFEHIDFSRYLLMTLQYLICNDYNAGIQFICDFRKFTLGIVAKQSPILIANTAMIITEAFGLRLRGMHLLCGSKILDTLIAIVKQGLSKKLMSRLHIHENYESLYKHIPKDLLPKDIGGDLDTASEMAEKTFKELSSPEFIKYIKYMEGAATNESKRLCSEFNEEYSGMPGSFKNLTVD